MQSILLHLTIAVFISNPKYSPIPTTEKEINFTPAKASMALVCVTDSVLELGSAVYSSSPG